jgi:hypothetical protein
MHIAFCTQSAPLVQNPLRGDANARFQANRCRLFCPWHHACQPDSFPPPIRQVGVDAAAGTDTIRVRYRRRGREATAIIGIEKRERPRSRRRTDRHSVIVWRTVSLPLIRLYPNILGDCNGTFIG